MDYLAGKDIEDIFYPPLDKNASIPDDEKDVLQKFMDSVWITFVTVNKDARIEDVETKLQNDLVAKLHLAPKWIGDGGQDLARAGGECREDGMPVYKHSLPDILTTFMVGLGTELGSESNNI